MARQKDNTNAPQEKQRRTRRSKAEIEQDLSTAITRIITTQGFTKLTINNVSEESHVIKRVIYENYKSFERLLQVYFVKNDFWTALILSKIADRCSDYKEFFTAVLKEFYKSIDENPIFQCIVRWEVAAPNNFVRNGAKNRENNCREELLKNKAFFQPLGIDIEALYALLIAGIYHLVLRKDVSSFCNIDFTAKEGKERLLNLIDKIAEILFASFNRIEEKKRIASRLLSRGIPPREAAEILEVDESFILSISDTN